MLVDRVRGVSSYNWIASNSNGAELTTNTNGAISSIDSDGITVQNGNDSSSKSNNAGKNGETWVFWNWLAGGTTSSNGNGSITSTVSVNTTAGFSIVSYTGTGSAATVGHGLGVAPKMIIVKNLDSSENWGVWHTGIDADEYLGLNQTSAKATNTAIWNNTLPTSSVFSVANNARTGGSDDYVAYCFAEVKGFSRFGSYVGNGSSDGSYIHLGFRPAWVMIKRTNASSTSWVIHDNKRNPFNSVDARLWADLTNASTTSSSYNIDFLSNGFKTRNTNSLVNTSGGSYIYMAFAEHPFVTEGTKAAGTAR